MSGKNYKASQKLVNRETKYPVSEALDLVIKTSKAKFDESVDVSIRLGVDPKQSDQQVRGAVALPNGIGKDVKIIVFAKGPKEEEAKAAGADFVGSDELVEKIKGGWLDFDKAIATPDMMATVSKVAKLLGPRGLMPNPKLGTVTMNVGEAVKTEKKGKLAYRVEKAGIVHASIGRKSMGVESLGQNFGTLISALQKAKPSSSKGVYFKSINLSATMGVGVKVDVGSAESIAE